MTYPFSYCPACGERAPTFADGKQLQCALCGLQYFHNVAAAVGVFIRHRQHVLLAERGREPGQGMLDLPGGFVEPGESLEQGLQREISEELGIELSRPSYLFSFANNYRYEGVLYRTVDAMFEVVVAQRPHVVAADDVSALTWVRLSDVNLSDLAFDSVKAAVTTLRQPNRS